MTFEAISPLVQHALSFLLRGSVALVAVTLVSIGGGRLLQLWYAGRVPPT